MARTRCFNNNPKPKSVIQLRDKFSQLSLQNTLTEGEKSGAVKVQSNKEIRSNMVTAFDLDVDLDDPGVVLPPIEEGTEEVDDWRLVQRNSKGSPCNSGVDKVSFMPNGVFLIIFSNVEEQEQALQKGVVLYDHQHVIIPKCTPEAVLAKESIKVVPIWGNCLNQS